MKKKKFTPAKHKSKLGDCLLSSIFNNSHYLNSFFKSRLLNDYESKVSIWDYIVYHA